EQVEWRARRDKAAQNMCIDRPMPVAALQGAAFSTGRADQPVVDDTADAREIAAGIQPKVIWLSSPVFNAAVRNIDGEIRRGELRLREALCGQIRQIIARRRLRAI